MERVAFLCSQQSHGPVRLCSFNSWHYILRGQCWAQAVILGKVNIWKTSVLFFLSTQSRPERELGLCWVGSDAWRDANWVRKVVPPTGRKQIPDTDMCKMMPLWHLHSWPNKNSTVLSLCPNVWPGLQLKCRSLDSIPYLLDLQ